MGFTQAEFEAFHEQYMVDNASFKDFMSTVEDDILNLYGHYDELTDRADQADENIARIDAALDERNEDRAQLASERALKEAAQQELARVSNELQDALRAARDDHQRERTLRERECTLRERAELELVRARETADQELTRVRNELLGERESLALVREDLALAREDYQRERGLREKEEASANTEHNLRVEAERREQSVIESLERAEEREEFERQSRIDAEQGKDRQQHLREKAEKALSKAKERERAYGIVASVIIIIGATYWVNNTDTIGFDNDHEWDEYAMSSGNSNNIFAPLLNDVNHYLVEMWEFVIKLWGYFSHLLFGQ